MEMIEKMARAIAAEHYAQRFNKAIDDEEAGV